MSSAFAPFDVVVVPFPHADRLVEKRRPAVVVSAKKLISQHGLVWLAMITSASNRRWADDITVSDLGVTGLPAPSLIRPAKVTTADSARVIRRIGKLPVADTKALAKALQRLMAS
ncbi:MAG: type II toxin-antitoxin system PemK/MazF family toxin [Alphaproteobacteria bacterium]|nr:type II toxin-antitoxin system PemK/MazF family toxin [Alphaproteobacteria bacterium]MBL7098729.1 type II toxin-antitoxin system PemK/MazF family toxin [Alphaproteobacteria bacterium]